MNTATPAAPPPRPSLLLSAAALREIALFGALSDEVLDRLAATLTVLHTEAGAFVFREGDTAREFFVVLDGEIEILKSSKSGLESRVALLGPGDCFGEMSIIDLLPRSASARAVAPTRLVRVGSDDMDALYRFDLKSYTLIVLNIARDLSRRLRVTDSLLADISANLLANYAARPSKRP